MISKKITSTVLLFLIFAGFSWWGLASLVSEFSTKTRDGEAIVYSFLILGCALAALVALLMLPRKRQQ